MSDLTALLLKLPIRIVQDSASRDHLSSYFKLALSSFLHFPLADFKRFSCTFSLLLKLHRCEISSTGAPFHLKSIMFVFGVTEISGTVRRQTSCASYCSYYVPVLPFPAITIHPILLAGLSATSTDCINVSL